MEAQNSVQPKKILMIAGDFVEDSEVMVPFQILTMVGHIVHAVSPNKKSGDTIKTAIHDREDDQTYTEKVGHNFKLTFDFDQVKEQDYNGLIIPGGRCPEFLRLNQRVLEITRYFIDNNKPLASVCHGPQVLTAAGGIKGRTISCTWGCYTEVEQAGAILKKLGPTEAVTDGNLVTAPGKWAHPEWMRQFLVVLGTGFCSVNPK